jgi:hypothetical protein
MPPQAQPHAPVPPQHGQPHPPYPQQGQPHPQQYGHPPYGPPQKKSNLGLILILVGVFVFLPMVGCLGLAAIPLITSNASDARRAEGEAVAGTVKTQLRAMYAKTGEIPQAHDPAVQTILQSGVSEYISSVSYTPVGQDKGRITVQMVSGSDGQLTTEFEFNTGNATFNWVP